MAAILAYRISRIQPITFSFAMNDYGFELLSDQPIPVDDTNVYELFSPDDLLNDIQRSVNSTEMAKRKFRDIAVIGGLIFQGMPGEKKKARHLQSSASLLFKVFSEYDPHNLLLRQSYQEVLDQQMEELMKQLTDREGNINRYRYGLSDGMVHTLEETGKAFNLTRERIRQIEKDVMKRLRLYVASHQDDFTP